MKNLKKESTSKIKKAREKRGWTQEYLAKITGLSRGHLNRIENDKHELTLKVAKSLSYALGLKIEEL